MFVWIQDDLVNFLVQIRFELDQKLLGWLEWDSVLCVWVEREGVWLGNLRYYTFVGTVENCELYPCLIIVIHTWPLESLRVIMLTPVRELTKKFRFQLKMLKHYLKNTRSIRYFTTPHLLLTGPVIKFKIKLPFLKKMIASIYKLISLRLKRE